MQDRTDKIHDLLDRFGSDAESRAEAPSDRVGDYCFAIEQLEKARIKAPEGLTGRIMAALPEKPDRFPGHRIFRQFKEWLRRPWHTPALAGGLALLLLGILWLHFSEKPSNLMAVEFDLFAPKAKSVQLVGTFNHWLPQTLNLTGPDDVGHWSAKVSIPPGRHEYLFLVDGKELISDPDAQAFAPDGYGRFNSVVMVWPNSENDISRSALQAATLPLPSLPQNADPQWAGLVQEARKAAPDQECWPRLVVNLALAGFTPEQGRNLMKPILLGIRKHWPLDRLLLDLQEGITKKRSYEGLEQATVFHLRSTEEAFQALNVAGLDPPQHHRSSLVHKLVQAQEYGLSTEALKDLLFNAGKDRWPRVLQALDIGMTLKLAGIPDVEIEAFMLDSLALDLDSKEIDRMIKHLLLNRKSGRTMPEIRKSLGFGPETAQI